MGSIQFPSETYSLHITQATLSLSLRCKYVHISQTFAFWLNISHFTIRLVYFIANIICVAKNLLYKRITYMILWLAAERYSKYSGFLLKSLPSRLCDRRNENVYIKRNGNTEPNDLLINYYTTWSVRGFTYGFYRDSYVVSICFFMLHTAFFMLWPFGGKFGLVYSLPCWRACVCFDGTVWRVEKVQITCLNYLGDYIQICCIAKKWYHLTLITFRQWRRRKKCCCSCIGTILNYPIHLLLNYCVIFANRCAFRKGNWC